MLCLSKTITEQHKAYVQKSHIYQLSAQENQQDDTSSSDDEYLYTLEQEASSAKTPTISVQIGGGTVGRIVDTGAS